MEYHTGPSLSSETRRRNSLRALRKWGNRNQAERGAVAGLGAILCQSDPD